MIVCKICYDKIKNKIKCKSDCKNNETDICNNCIINLNIDNINILKNNIVIDNEYIKCDSNYNNIIINYICPYCNHISYYKLTDIIDKENIIKLSINILKFMIIKSNNNEILIEKLYDKNDKLQIELNNKSFYNKYDNRCCIISIIICMKMIIVFIFIFLNKYTIYIK